MLNELYDAASSLANAGIKPKNWHKEYVPIRAPKLAFFVYINNQGEIADIERISDPTEVADLRTWESKGDLRQSFPYFNIPPLMWIQFDPKKNENDRLIEKAMKANSLSREQLGQFIEKAQGADTTKKWGSALTKQRVWINPEKKLQSCLEKGGTLKSILGKAPDEFQSVIALIERLEKNSADVFYEQFLNVLGDKIKGYPEMTGRYFDALFYLDKEVPGIKKENEPGNSITLLLELSDGSHFDFPVRHTKVRDWINQRLLAQSPAQEDSSSVHDIFDNDGLGWDQSFDDVRMKNVLGNVKLRAMVAAAECQFRYGKAEADSCPVGQDSRSKMKGALEWLIDPEREGKTWTTVSRATDNKEVLLAYPSVLPPEPPDTATFFGGSSDSDADNTGRFENCAKNVTGTLRVLMAKNPDLDIRVFVLRKMDPARTRVSSHRRYSAQRLLQASELWQQGCRNLPHIMVKQFTKEKKTEWREPETPFPMEVVWTLNTIWSRGGKGTEKNKTASQPQWAPSSVKGLATEDGISLLLEDGVFLQPVLLRALYGVTRNAVGLVLALGQAHAHGQVFAAKSYMRQAIILPSILGLLLFKMNITKEEYMKSAPYLVGRLLSFADQLHYHYCQHVRDGSVPPQLMGNALMPTALEEPVKALALYCNRVLPYQAWAKTTSDEKAVGLARYFLAELGKVCSELGEVCSDPPSTTLPERCTDLDKAQMLIGYLARPEKSDSDTTQ